MPYQLTVSPDFTPDHISGWYIFNTWLQRTWGENIHLELYNNFNSQRAAIESDKIDLIYANPFDAAILVREKRFLPVAKPIHTSDEALIAVCKESPIHHVEDLPERVSIATTDDPDVNLMCAMMLEPAEITPDNADRQIKDNYPLVAKTVLQGQAELGFFLHEAFYSLSGITRNRLRPLVTSQIQIIHHTLLIGPRLASKRKKVCDLLINMPQLSKGAGVLISLGIDGWAAVDDEEMEFMIDLMDTLNYLPA
ncbi:MAG: phosphate/phosphite/phosphonate ABC transporter substrate-binding protein [Candidatus Thiodiazotropha sp.]|jgi:phosphonate transport system substrate-binding protein